MEWNCSVFFVKCWPAEYVVTQCDCDVPMSHWSTLGTSLAWQCYVASHQMINFSTNHLFTELSARVASENLLKTLNVTSFCFRTQTLGLSWLAVTQPSFWQLSSAPSSHTLRFRQSWAPATLHWPGALMVSMSFGLDGFSWVVMISVFNSIVCIIFVGLQPLFSPLFYVFLVAFWLLLVFYFILCSSSNFTWH